MISPTERMIAEIDGPIGWMVFNNPAKAQCDGARYVGGDPDRSSIITRRIRRCGSSC